MTVPAHWCGLLAQLVAVPEIMQAEGCSADEAAKRYREIVDAAAEPASNVIYGVDFRKGEPNQPPDIVA